MEGRKLRVMVVIPYSTAQYTKAMSGWVNEDIIYRMCHKGSESPKIGAY